MQNEELTISVGGEIGEVGKSNSTPDELRAYLDGFNGDFDGARRRRRHRPLQGQRPDRHLPRWRAHRRRRAWPRSSSTSRSCASSGIVAREYGLAGAVQHGASTLPDELFHRFPEVETAEIHLATGFQNALYEHPAFPAELYARSSSTASTTSPTSAPRARPTRSSCTRPARRRSARSSASCGTSATKDEIIASQQAKMKYLFEQLGITGNRATVEKHVSAPERHKPVPGRASRRSPAASHYHPANARPRGATSSSIVAGTPCGSRRWSFRRSSCATARTVNPDWVGKISTCSTKPPSPMPSATSRSPSSDRDIVSLDMVKEICASTARLSRSRSS